MNTFHHRFYSKPLKFPPKHKVVHIEILNNNRINIKLLWNFSKCKPCMKYCNNFLPSKIFATLGKLNMNEFREKRKIFFNWNAGIADKRTADVKLGDGKKSICFTVDKMLTQKKKKPENWNLLRKIVEQTAKLPSIQF